MHCKFVAISFVVLVCQIAIERSCHKVASQVQIYGIQKGLWIRDMGEACGFQKTYRNISRRIQKHENVKRILNY